MPEIGLCGEIPPSPGLGGLDHAVDALQDAAVDLSVEPVEWEALPVAIDGTVGLFDRLQATVGRSGSTTSSGTALHVQGAAAGTLEKPVWGMVGVSKREIPDPLSALEKARGCEQGKMNNKKGIDGDSDHLVAGRKKNHGPIPISGLPRLDSRRRTYTNASDPFETAPCPVGQENVRRSVWDRCPLIIVAFIQAGRGEGDSPRGKPAGIFSENVNSSCDDWPSGAFGTCVY